jgi:hypothetical protein
MGMTEEFLALSFFIVVFGALAIGSGEVKSRYLQGFL